MCLTTVEIDPQLYLIHGCVRSTVLLSPWLYSIHGCNRSAVVLDLQLHSIYGYNRSMTVLNLWLKLMRGCSRSTVVLHLYCSWYYTAALMIAVVCSPCRSYQTFFWLLWLKTMNISRYNSFAHLQILEYCFVVSFFLVAANARNMSQERVSPRALQIKYSSKRGKKWIRALPRSTCGRS